MKAKLVPVFFQSAQDPDFVIQLANLKTLLVEEAEILDPVALGEMLPDTDGVIFPQMLGDAYRKLELLRTLPQPLMVITSEFGTVSMWDWEIVSYLKTKDVKTIAPNSLEKTRQACRAFALRRQLRKSKFLIYQDNPASVGGNQDDIFKRFYWLEPECLNAIKQKYGVDIVKKSFKNLAAEAKAIPDSQAEAVWQAREVKTPVRNISKRAILSAVKIYIQVKRDLDSDPSIVSVGINCLNESRFSETTPCLAWNLLFEDQRMVWGCEADLVSMLTEVLVSKTLDVPFMMTNLYPFLMGKAALHHEHIPNFPSVESDPDNYILAAHCGFLGVVPQSFSTQWILGEKVLAIVDDNASAIDARLPEGEITLVKLIPPFDAISVIEGDLTAYAQFPGSHCLNGAVICVPDGRRFVDEVVSHHYILACGHNLNALEMVSEIFNLDYVTIR
jgi:hypothetical protein